MWGADITYVPIGRGFLYLVAIMDWASLTVLAWRPSNTLGVSFCVSALEEALARHGRPEIFNTDQGSQFTSAAFTGALAASGVRISMDGRGRRLDNVFIERLWRSLKHEDIYLKGYADGRGSDRPPGREPRLKLVWNLFVGEDRRDRGRRSAHPRGWRDGHDHGLRRWWAVAQRRMRTDGVVVASP